MHVTLHITTGCNMRCGYCYSPPVNRADMSEETARAAVDFSARLNPVNTGIIFFGGEPLLRRELIESTIDYCAHLRKKHGYSFHYKVTTNGTLLDEDFLDYAASVGLTIALSIDGTPQAHDTHRRTAAGTGSFDLIKDKIPLLLRRQPYASAFMTVTPETVGLYESSARFLIDAGFKYLIVSLNYAGDWTDDHVRELTRQYRKLSKLYEKLTLEQKKFYFSPFEMKFSSHIRGEDALCHRCALGMRQVSVAPDGAIYPCVQFVKDGWSNRQYSIGHVESGIDEEKRFALYLQSQKRDAACETCELNPRCNNDCSCLNWQTTGVINGISPLVCETERAIIPIVDRLGKKLYSRRAPMFIQKHYNAVYPIISLIDDLQGP